MRNAQSDEERKKIVAERSAWERTQAVEELRSQLGVSDQEWAVIKPRIETAYDLVYPQPRFGCGGVRPATPAERKRNELRELLGNKEATPDQIKGALISLRAANEKARQEPAKARQDLCRVLTLRQGALLVLRELRD